MYSHLCVHAPKPKVIVIDPVIATIDTDSRITSREIDTCEFRTRRLVKFVVYFCDL